MFGYPWDGHGHAKLPIANLILFTSDREVKMECLVSRSDAYKLAEALSLSLERDCPVLPLMLEGSRRAVWVSELSVARCQQCVAAHA